MANIHEFIAAISPETYCVAEIEDENGKTINLAEKVRKTFKEKGFKEALKIAKPKKENQIPFKFDEARKDAMSAIGLKSPIEQHSITYDAPGEGLEPMYFYLLDFIQGMGAKIDKITDNFVSSPGSGHFSEMQSKLTQMQQEVSRTMGNINTVIKSVLNLVYDLKEFKLRLKPYKEYYKAKKEKNEKEIEKSLLSLKQIWLDNVDIRKGRGSINALASGELDFVTLRDAFMVIMNSELKDKAGNIIDLNDRVKRILVQRSEEFFNWIDESYNSLTQRYAIEKNYLRSQQSMLQLYIRWVKPYLKSAQKLEQQYNSSSSALVTAFNTTLLELSLIATWGYDIQDDVKTGTVPDIFRTAKPKNRQYNKVLILEFDFRSIPQKVSQRGDWAFGGKANIKFSAYALNNQELEILKTELQRDDFDSVMKLIEGATDQSLKPIQEEIEAILNEKEDDEDGEKKKKAELDTKKKAEDISPFKPLWDSFKDIFKMADKEEDKTKKEEYKTKGPDKDSEFEKVIRSQAIISARETCFTVFDVYKKSRGMPSHDSHYEAF